MEDLQIVDSSSWIEYFRENEKYLFLDDLIDTGKVCVNDIILAELLPSIIYRKEHRLVEILNSVKRYPLYIDWQEICAIQLLNIEHGNNHISILDIIIAQNCIQNGLKLVTHDKHFGAMAKYIPLKLVL